MILSAFCGTAGAVDYWEMEPIRYSDTQATDRIARLAADLASGKTTLKGETDLQKLAGVLEMLDVPVESQVLVYSQTSQQNALIRPKNPRCLYFNENSYVGFVPGGDIEIITHDPVLGMTFYLIDLAQKDPAKIVARDGNACLACHGTRRTESVPGVLIRSVHPDEDGHLILKLGMDHIDARSPIPIRWGGYYVTGNSSLPHLGNRIYTEADERDGVTEAVQHRTLDDVIDVSKYLRNTSDIVSLMVLEHQCRMHNLLVSASMEYRRLHWFSKTLEPDADPDDGRAGKTADEHAVAIVEAMLFKDEAPMGDGGVDGDAAFQDAFAARYPKTDDGGTLAEFQLGSRLFKSRCSYMIYSQAFKVLPPRVKGAVFSRLKEVLEQGKDFPEIGEKERRRISEILRRTVEGYSRE
ncbi:MAG: hypothetical protein KF712_17155 [Akkermansiaceae bacterium]|nr:hypothetical protein [Akkermansiaceae bacterium]